MYCKICIKLTLFIAGQKLYGCDSKSRVVSFGVCYEVAECGFISNIEREAGVDRVGSDDGKGQEGHPPEESELKVDGSIFYRVSAIHAHIERYSNQIFSSLTFYKTRRRVVWTQVLLY